MSRKESVKNLENAEAYILISFDKNGMRIDKLIGDLCFTMLGGIELAKMQLLDEFKCSVEKHLIED